MKVLSDVKLDVKYIPQLSTCRFHHPIFPVFDSPETILPPHLCFPNSQQDVDTPNLSEILLRYSGFQCSMCGAAGHTDPLGSDPISTATMPLPDWCHKPKLSMGCCSRIQTSFPDGRSRILARPAD